MTLYMASRCSPVGSVRRCPTRRAMAAASFPSIFTIWRPSAPTRSLRRGGSRRSSWRSARRDAESWSFTLYIVAFTLAFTPAFTLSFTPTITPVRAQGRIVGTGCDSAVAARLAVTRAARQIANEAGIFLRLRNFAVINIVAAASINAKLDCDGFADSHSADSHFDRASFVGASPKFTSDPSTSLPLSTHPLSCCCPGLAWRPAGEACCCGARDWIQSLSPPIGRCTRI